MGDVPSESDDRLSLGPDSAGQLTFWVGVPGATFFAVTMGYLAPPLAGVMAVMWLFAVWYSWRAGFRTSIATDQINLRVVTPMRTFVTPWEKVRSIRFSAKITVRTDRSKFHIPLYTSTIVTDTLARTTPLFSTRGRLETAMTKALRANAGRSTTGSPEAEIVGVYPPKAVVVLALLAGAVIEVLVLVLN